MTVPPFEVWSPCDTTPMGYSAKLEVTQCWQMVNTACDPIMASLQTLINHFLVENRTCPELCDVLIKELEMWINKSAEIDIGSSVTVSHDSDINHNWSSHNSWRPWSLGKMWICCGGPVRI